MDQTTPSARGAGTWKAAYHETRWRVSTGWRVTFELAEMSLLHGKMPTRPEERTTLLLPSDQARLVIRSASSARIASLICLRPLDRAATRTSACDLSNTSWTPWLSGTSATVDPKRDTDWNPSLEWFGASNVIRLEPAAVLAPTEPRRGHLIRAFAWHLAQKVR
jgi:hypothetical protein